MKILVIKLGALGDLINSTAIIKQITEHHKNSSITILTSPAFTELLTSFKNVKIKAFSRKGLFNTFKTIVWLRTEKFDRIYDLQSNDRTTILCALSGAPYRAGNHPRFPYHAHPKNPYIGECHSFERLNQIIESAGIKRAKPLPFLPVPDKTKAEISQWLSRHNLIEKSFAILHAGSSPLHIKKRWPYFSALASALSETMKVVWVGGKDDVELNSILSKNTGIDATNAFSILGLVELGKHAKFAVTNDSAPMHILSCSQIPVFGLFGPTYPRRTHALGQFENVITPDNLIAQNDQGFVPKDISDITLDAVLTKLKDQSLI